MEILSIETIKNGLIAGAAVAAVSAIAVASVGALVNDTEGGLAGFAGKWALIALVFGVASAAGYALLNGTLSLDPTGYLYLALGLATALTVLEFLPIYEANAFAPHWQVYAVLNYVFALGFGHLVPRLMG